jgi:hypothetical protein
MPCASAFTACAKDHARRAAVAHRMAADPEIVKPDTLIGWYRKGFRLFWRRKSKPRGRPRLLGDLRQLISNVATANRTSGEEPIAAQILEAWVAVIAANRSPLCALGTGVWLLKSPFLLRQLMLQPTMDTLRGDDLGAYRAPRGPPNMGARSRVAVHRSHGIEGLSGTNP